MDLHFLNNAVAVGVLVLSLAVLPACSDAVRLVHETDTGGVVTYLYKEDRGGPMGSPYRREALQVIDRKCPVGYTVVRDGEAKGATISTLEGEEGEIRGRRWGIQFRCK